MPFPVPFIAGKEPGAAQEVGNVPVRLLLLSAIICIKGRAPAPHSGGRVPVSSFSVIVNSLHVIAPVDSKTFQPDPKRPSDKTMCK